MTESAMVVSSDRAYDANYSEPLTQTVGGRLRVEAAITAAGPTAGPTIGTITSVNDNNISTTLLADNPSRKGASFYNDSTVLLYLSCSTATASSTSYTVQVPAQGFYELPACQGGVYTGIVKGIWASDASGAVRVTEYT